MKAEPPEVHPLWLLSQAEKQKNLELGIITDVARGPRALGLVAIVRAHTLQFL